MRNLKRLLTSILNLKKNTFSNFWCFLFAVELTVSHGAALKICNFNENVNKQNNAALCKFKTSSPLSQCVATGCYVGK